MQLRVRRSIKIAPGVRLNVGKKSVGLSFGTRGARYSINSSGRRTATIGIPGSGISYSVSSRKKHSSAHAKMKKLEKEWEQARKARERQMAQAKREQERKLALEYAKATVEEYETKIDAITTIHRGAIEPYHWKQIEKVPAPFTLGEKGPREIEARKNQEEYKPGFFAKRISSLENSQKIALDKAIEVAIREDREEYENWKDIHNLATRIIELDTDAMLDAIERAEIFEDLAEYGSGFEISFVNSIVVEVEFDIMADTVVPKTACSLTSSGGLSQRPIPVSKRLDIMQDYVCSSALRIARDLFALLPIGAVLLHAKDNFLDTSVGHSEKQDILSVFITYPNLEKLNFDLIDPSDAMANFPCNMKFLKTKGFQPISRIKVITKTDLGTGKEQVTIEY